MTDDARDGRETDERPTGGPDTDPAGDQTSSRRRDAGDEPGSGDATDGTCGAEKKNGESCETDFGLCGCHGMCWAHAPCRENDRKWAQQKGGHATAQTRRRKKRRLAALEEIPEPPETMEDAAQWASWAIAAVTVGRIDARTCREISTAVTAFRKALEKAESRKELEELKDELRALAARGELKAVD